MKKLRKNMKEKLYYKGCKYYRHPFKIKLIFLIKIIPKEKSGFPPFTNYMMI